MQAKVIRYLAILLVIYTVNAHMELANPPPRRSKFNPFVPEPQRDYNMVAPLLASGANFPCKRYPAADVVSTYQAGETVSVQMSGDIFHEGGHCQFSISYDDQTFVVLKTVMKNCFVGTGKTFAVTIPSTTPACDRCTFAWSWANAVGNRELYMNCADIRIINNSPDRQYLTGKNYTVVNMPGYVTIPEFPPSTYDGSDLWDNAPIVTVEGGTASPSSTTAGPQPPSTSSPPAPPTTTRAPSPSGTCVENESKCGSTPSTWSLCSNNVFYTRPCPPGTVCSFTDGVAQCVLDNAPATNAPESTTSSPPATSAPTTTTTTAAPTTSTAPVPTTAAPGGCTTGQTKCISTSKWALCSNNVFYTMNCAPGTSCVFKNNAISCE